MGRKEVEGGKEGKGGEGSEETQEAIESFWRIQGAMLLKPRNLIIWLCGKGGKKVGPLGAGGRIIIYLT